MAFTVWCALVTAGLPPLSGFVAKLAMLSALLEQRDAASLDAVCAAGRVGPVRRHRVDARGDAPLLDRQDRPAPRLRVIETLPIAVLLATSMPTLVLQAEAGLAYTRAAADSCIRPASTSTP